MSQHLTAKSWKSGEPKQWKYRWKRYIIVVLYAIQTIQLTLRQHFNVYPSQMWTMSCLTEGSCAKLWVTNICSVNICLLVLVQVMQSDWYVVTAAGRWQREPCGGHSDTEYHGNTRAADSLDPLLEELKQPWFLIPKIHGSFFATCKDFICLGHLGIDKL